MPKPCVLMLLCGIGCPLAIAGGDPYAAPDTYYSGATGTGTALKSQLAAAMAAGHIQRNYGDFRDMSRFIDADPDTPGNILLVYNRASVSGNWDSGQTWNREHVWPQSRQPGSASNSSTGNLGDPHALRPANPSINSSRGNKPFGGGGATVGPHRSLGAFYFPGDDDKGDVARSLFYSDTRYASTGLSLVNAFPSGNQMGDLQSLIEWHYLDTPDDFERRRNHAVYSVTLNPLFTRNRNAYIDHPEFVWSVYMNQMNDSTLFVGDLEPADGASEIGLDLGNLLVGDPVAPIVTDLNKSGQDGTYYRVSSGDSITTDLDGPFRAFPIGSDGASQPMTISFAPSFTDTPGIVFASVIVDNLDVTTQGGPGNGANDGDDLVSISASVFNAGNGSFDALSDLNAIGVDLGTIGLDSGDASASIDLFNIAPGDAFAAPIDIEIISSTGDTDVLLADLGVITDLGSEGTAFQVILDDQVKGQYTATYTLRVYNSRALFPDADGVEDLTLNLTGSVGVPSCPADINGDGNLNFFDVSLFLGAFSNGDPLADFNEDGQLNFFDVSLFLGAFSAGCP